MTAASATSATAMPSRAAKWTGWTLSGLVIVFMAMDTAMKLADIAPVRQAAGQIGWPLALDRPLGIIDLVGLVLYAIPRTSALGAVYLTGLLGGAVAAHLRLGDPLFSHILFGVYVGVMMWGGLWLRDERVRALLPILRSGRA
jgi:DoxX-like family